VSALRWEPGKSFSSHSFHERAGAWSVFFCPSRYLPQWLLFHGVELVSEHRSREEAHAEAQRRTDGAECPVHREHGDERFGCTCGGGS
jgi:hypothetical protein